MSETWSIANPRLWYRDDLVNHPELIPLEGQCVPESEVDELYRKTYHGNMLLTKPIEKLRSSAGFINNELTLTVSFFQGLYVPSALFEGPLTIDNFKHVTDQWLTGSSDPYTRHHVNIRFHSTPMVANEYWMIPAAGDSQYIDLQRPTPKTWQLLGRNGGLPWQLVDYQELKENTWEPWKVKTFKVDNRAAYQEYQLLITSWFSPNNDAKLYSGLRRFWLFGHPLNQFVMPDIPSPSDAYVWVIPRSSKQN